MLKTHYLKFLLLPFIALLLAACGDEPTERQTYNQFLTELSTTPNNTFIFATEENVKSFGRYKKSYNIMVNFLKNSEKSTEQESKLMNDALSLLSLNYVKDNWQSIDDIQKGFNEVSEKQYDEFQAFKKSIEVLQLPEDTKKLYDNVINLKFKKFTNIPEIQKHFNEVTSLYKEIGQFLSRYQDKVEIKGSSVVINDDNLLNQFNTLIAKLNSAGQALKKASE